MGLCIRVVGRSVLAASLAWEAIAPAVAAELEVQVKGIAHSQGDVRLALYSMPEGFRKEDRAFALKSLSARPGDISVSFPNIAEGRYAVIVYHDENANGQMDKFLGMVPTEGYGLTNNPEVTGPPQFDECALEVKGAAPTQTIVQLKY